MRRLLIGVVAVVLLSVGSSVSAQNPKDMSGMPLPVSDVPIGTVSVRVIRGDFEHDLPNQPVQFTIDGQLRTVVTGADGRALVSGLRVGAKVDIVAVVDGQRLESQPLTIGSSGIRMILVATDPAAPGASTMGAPANQPVQKGSVTFGPQSRIIVEVAEDALNVFYVFDIANVTAAPVDIGGPVIIDLPAEARGVGVLDGSSPQAKANGPHIRVLGPFAPGDTHVEIGYELPFSGGSVELAQRWPATMPRTELLIQRLPDLDVQSAQIAKRSNVSSDSGQPLVLLEGPAVAAGNTLTLEFSGLPHRPMWPRNLALGLALVIAAWGLWAALRKSPAPGVLPARVQLQTERDRLLEALAALDHRHALGRVPAAVHAEERRQLVAELERIYATIDSTAA